MDTKTIFEIIGYAASILVAISLLMSSLLKLRLINLAGAVCFVVYGLFIGAYPIAIVNLIIIGINLYYLYQIYSTKEYFTLLEINHDSEYLKSFLQFHAQEIQRFLPDFTYLPNETSLIFFILRDMVPAGLFIAEVRGGGALWVNLDFVIPGYRDFKVGQFLYAQKAAFFKDKGIRKIYSASGNAAHAHYLRQMGFSADSSDTTGALYSRTID
jgi:hypothetical protein